MPLRTAFEWKKLETDVVFLCGMVIAVYSFAETGLLLFFSLVVEH